MNLLQRTERAGLDSFQKRLERCYLYRELEEKQEEEEEEATRSTETAREVPQLQRVDGINLDYLSVGRRRGLTRGGGTAQLTADHVLMVICTE